MKTNMMDAIVSPHQIVVSIISLNVHQKQIELVGDVDDFIIDTFLFPTFHYIQPLIDLNT